MVYGTLRVSSCVTQPVGFLGEPKTQLESFCRLWVFSSLRHKPNPYYPLPLPMGAAENIYSPEGFGMPYFFSLQLCDPAGAGVSTASKEE